MNSDSLNASSSAKRALRTIQILQQRLTDLEERAREPIAIVGIGCRFPAADSADAFFQLLCDGVDATTEVPRDRWGMDLLYDPSPDAPGKMYVRRGGFMEDVHGFDAPFFGVSPREAESMDPQQRLLLEVSWEALENAGVAPDRLSGTGAGVFLGITSFDHGILLAHDPTTLNGHYASGSALSAAAGRLSYVLGLCGPSLAVDTACSSALVAVHLACQSLRLRETDLAIAGGVNLMLGAAATIATCKARMLSADGRCKTFDASADGYARGEGCGMVILKRLSDARADGDRIIAAIRGSAVNQDGASGGFTVPSGLAQRAVIRAALEQARLAPARIGYLEAHGTGTALGDPIELEAAGDVLGAGRAPDERLLVGSVKTNVGHLEAAAGIAGLIKAALCVERGIVPPHLHLTHPNPHVPWSSLPLDVPRELRSWHSTELRAAGVSAFGFSGTNAHAIVEEVREPVRAASLPGGVHVVTLSARSESALSKLVEAYATALGSPRGCELSIADVAFTTHVGRAHMAHRLAIVAESTEEASRLLSLARASGADRAAGVVSRVAAALRVGFVATPRGTSLAFEPLERYCASADAIARCNAHLAERGGGSIRARAERGGDGASAVAIAFAECELWRSWGIEPAAVLGRGDGRYAAACLAGAITVEKALDLAIAHDDEARARAVRSHAPGIQLIDDVADRDPAAALAALGFTPIVLGEDDDRGIPRTLARLYAAGAPIGFAAVHAHDRRRKVVLPTYPFEHLTPPDTTSLRDRLRPLPSVAALPGAKLFQLDVTGPLLDELRDHRVHEAAVMPGVAYLEMARATAENALHEGHFDVEDVSFENVLLLPPNGVSLQLTLSPCSVASFEFRAYSQSAGLPSQPWTLHARAKVRRVDQPMERI